MSDNDRKIQHLTAGILVFLLGLVISVSSIPLFGRVVVKDVGPGMFPLIVGILLILLGLFEAFATIRRGSLTASPNAKNPIKIISQYFLEFVLVGILVLYFIFINIFGFLVSTAGFLMITSIIFGARKWWEIILVSVGASVGLFWIFDWLLSLTLPRGLLIF